MGEAIPVWEEVGERNQKNAERARGCAERYPHGLEGGVQLTLKRALGPDLTARDRSEE